MCEGFHKTQLISAIYCTNTNIKNVLDNTVQVNLNTHIKSVEEILFVLKAMDDIGVIMTSFGDVVMRYVQKPCQ